jgi:hypothetical protein
MCRLSRNSGASTSWNPRGLSRPVAGKLYLYNVLCVAPLFVVPGVPDLMNIAVSPISTRINIIMYVDVLIVICEHTFTECEHSVNVSPD